MHYPLSTERIRETFELPDGSGAFAASFKSVFAIVADFAFALRKEHPALFVGRGAAPNARAVQQTRITHVILPTFEEVRHAQHGAPDSFFE